MADDDVLADVDMRKDGDADDAAGGSGAARKGRGWKGEDDGDDRYAGKSGAFEALESEEGPGPQKCTWERSAPAAACM